MSREDLVTVVAAATLTLLRRDMSLNRRLYAWLLGLLLTLTFTHSHANTFTHSHANTFTHSLTR